MKKTKNSKRVIVVMPAYNAAKTLRKTFLSIPKNGIYKVILVDDGSHDRTVMLAKKLGIETFVHPQNRGYGGNQKTCYTMAINEGADVVVMIHPDYQYDASLTNYLVGPILEDRFEIMLGSRIRTRKEALSGGMPAYKYYANRFLTILENIILGQNLSEYHTGFRAFDKKVLTRVPFHKFSDDFVFDQDILVSAIKEGFRVGEVQVPVRYFKDSSSINFQRSVKYGFEILWDLFRYAISNLGLLESKIFANSND